jgi:hypothetical protein
MTFDKEKSFAKVDELCKNMKKSDIALLTNVIKSFADFRTKNITYEQLDSILLFTPKNVKNAAYEIEETMYPNQTSIRELIEVDL